MNQQERDQLNQVKNLTEGLESMVKNLQSMVETHFKNISPEEALKLNEELKKNNVNSILNNLRKEYESFKKI